MKDQATSLLKDRDWEAVEDEVCLVTEFVPMAKMVSGKVVAVDQRTPYAAVRFRCPRVEGETTGFVTHKIDFAMLWRAFNVRGDVEGTRTELGAFDKPFNDEGIGSNEEVWFLWSKKKKYRRGLGLFSGAFPRLVVMVSPRGAFELLTNQSLRPELSGEERFRAEAPLATWKPLVMEE